MPPLPKQESSSSDRLRLRSMVIDDDDVALFDVCCSIDRLGYSLDSNSEKEVRR